MRLGDPLNNNTRRVWLLFGIILCVPAFLPLLRPVNYSRATAAGIALAGWFTIGWIILYRSQHTSPQSNASDALKACKIPIADVKRITSAARMIGELGPSADLDETKRAIVEAARLALSTELTALFTIDPVLGDIECESNASTKHELQRAFVQLYSNYITDRERRQTWTVDHISGQDMSDKDAQQVLIDNNIDTIIACPIRSDTNACGALVAFYTSAQSCLESYIQIIEAITAQAATAISYALSMEQSRYLLDDLVGANQELALQATVDGLTGLPNHRTFQQTLSDLCRRSLVPGARPFSLVMVDVDHFKIYNDTHGHRQGDQVLQKVAKVMSSDLRQGDMAARYGGEEFVIIFQGVDKNAALVAADRIRRAISEQAWSNGVVTVSMGVAEFPVDTTTAGELIEYADKALYHAKITGRNRVYAWGTACTNDSNENEPTCEDSPQKAVLVVERAEEACAGLVQSALASPSYIVEVSNSAAAAAELLRTRVFDIALVSTEALPNNDIRTLGSLTAIHPHMPIVLLATDLPANESREALRRGAADILLKPYNPAELPVVIERNIERQRLELRRLVQKSTGIMLQAIEALVAAIDAKDHYTAGHSKRVTALALAISDDLNISNEERYALELASKLHDIGKLALPDSALNKQSPLTEDEWRAMREHPALGAKIVGAINELAYVSTIIRHHHERLDGTGYPDGLGGPAIPYLSRIIAVADAYEAMTSERAHRSRLTPTEAVEELLRHSRTYYSSEIVEVLRKQLIARGEIKSAENAA